jgi:hypothetical protein
LADPPLFAPGQTLPAEKLQALGSQGTLFVPTLTAATTNPNMGTTPDRQGIWYQLGPMVMYFFSLQFGTGGTVDPGSGQYFVSAPVPVLAGSLDKVSVGAGRATDDSESGGAGSNVLEVEMADSDASKLTFGVEEGRVVTAAVPWTWAANDRLWGHAFYPGDFS